MLSRKFTHFSFCNFLNFYRLSPFMKRNFHPSKIENARFVQFTCTDCSGSQCLGILDGDMKTIIGLSSESSRIPNNLMELLNSKQDMNKEISEIISTKKQCYDINNVSIIAPITKPDKIICVGLNYKCHCDEQKKPYPEQPFFFNKFPSTIVGPNDKIEYPKNSKALDWEVELAVIIGRRARNITVAEAYDYIFGYTIAQDISARDWQTPHRNNGQWIIAKSMNQSCPLGPSIVTKDDIPDPHVLDISCSINGVRKQFSNTKELIHPIDKLVSVLSELFTLLPGDVILTGTPGGVGVFRNPREFLKPGDVIQSEISSIGCFEVNVA